MEVVEQPLGRRRDGALLPNGLFDAAIGLEEDPAVVRESFGEPSVGAPDRGDALSGGERFRMLLESLGTEELAANRLGRVRWEHDAWVGVEALKD